jgi:hypothetical protein
MISLDFVRSFCPSSVHLYSVFTLKSNRMKYTSSVVLFIYANVNVCVLFFFSSFFRSRKKERREMYMNASYTSSSFIQSVTSLFSFSILAAFIDASIEGTVATYIHIYIYLCNYIVYFFFKERKKFE